MALGFLWDADKTSIQYKIGCLVLGMTLVEIFSLGNHPIPADLTYESLIEKLAEGWQPGNPLEKYSEDMEM